jgi:hypothetical protein
MVNKKEGMLVGAIRAFAAEHGTPNRVSPGELAAQYAAPVPREIGILMRNHQILLNEALKLHGLQARYQDRMIEVQST